MGVKISIKRMKWNGDKTQYNRENGINQGRHTERTRKQWRVQKGLLKHGSEIVRLSECTENMENYSWLSRSIIAYSDNPSEINELRS